MERAIRQLEHVRRIGRILLLTQQVIKWCSGLLLVALFCSVADFALRLPWWIRLVVGLAIAGTALTWIIGQLWRVFRFRPELGTLAQRAEHLFPQLSGTLASAVEFALDPRQYAHPGPTAAMVQASIRKARDASSGSPLRKLVGPTPTLRWLLLGLLVVAMVGGVAAAAPQDSVLLALRRWLMPMGSSQWPTRQRVVSHLNAEVAPFDQPLHLEASVVSGYSPGMRTWMYYRLIQPEIDHGPWQYRLMSERSDRGAHGGPARYERMLDLSKEMSAVFPDRILGELPRAAVACYFQAGDHRTSKQQVRLVPRPNVCGVSVTIEPPNYARGIVKPRTVSLIDSQQVGSETVTTSALRGADIRLVVSLNKPVPWAQALVGATLPGLESVKPVTVGDGAQDPENPAALDAASIALSFYLDQTVNTPIHITDEFGLSNMSERLYRIQALEDRPPMVSMLEPPADEAVLPTAQLDLQATAQDDVALEALQLDAQTQRRDSDGSLTPKVILASRSDRLERMALAHSLDLRSLELLPGDQLIISAVAQDIFDLKGRRHEPVRSSPRRLMIINSAELIRQLRSELGALRPKAIRIDAQQRALKNVDVPSAIPGQKQISRRLGNQRMVLDALDQRIKRNRVEAPILRELVEHGKTLLGRAGDASVLAEHHLEQTQEPNPQMDRDIVVEQARREQDQVRAALSELINLLDQSKDVLTLQLQLKQIEAAQTTLSDETRRMLPLTVAQDREDLDAGQKKRLDDVAQRQVDLGRQTRALVESMQSAVEGLRRGSDSPRDQAAADSLAQASAIALRQGLESGMQQTSKQIRDNRLSQAGKQQQDSLAVIRKMLEELNGQQRRRQQILRRYLEHLGESIARLVEQQTSHLQHLGNTDRLARLALTLEALRVNTLAVQDRADRAEPTRPVAKLLGEAAASQAEALPALRSNQRQPAVLAERQALAKLSEAIERVKEMRENMDADKTRQELDELKQRYAELARRQWELSEGTAEMEGKVRLDRQQRMKLFGLGNAQADLRMDAANLRDMLEQTTLFKHIHNQINELALRAAAELRMGQASGRLRVDQGRIASYLEQMAAALEQDPQEEQFGSGSSGSSGSSGGSGGRPKLVTALAELKLLNGIQEQIYLRTKVLDERAQHEKGHEEALRALAVEQRELADIGRRFMKEFAGGLQRLQRRQRNNRGQTKPNDREDQAIQDESSKDSVEIR